MTTDGTRIRRALDNVRRATDESRQLMLTVEETTALSQFIAELTAENDDTSAIERIHELETEREQVRTELRDSVEVNRVLASERDKAKHDRDTYAAAENDIRVILDEAAPTDDHPIRNLGTLEAIRWLVDDWRIERTANRIEDEAENNPRLAALRRAREIAPARGFPAFKTTADILAIADWLLAENPTEPAPELDLTTLSDIRR